MSGRIEVDNKIFVSIENKLKNMPKFVTEWYYNLRASETTASSCRDYITKLNNYIKFTCHDNIADVSCFSGENIARYMTYIQTRKVVENGVEKEIKTSDSYKQGIWSCLNNVCEFLYENGSINKNYVKNIKRPKNNDLEKINAKRMLLTGDDFSMILKSFDKNDDNKYSIAKKNKDRNLLIMLLFITTGMRKTALSEINISDIDFDNLTISVIDKREKRHIYKISDKTLSALNQWLTTRKTFRKADDTDALFISHNGSRLSGNEIYNIVNKQCNEALGHNVSPHKIRAGFCSAIYNETGDIEFTRRAVGHSNIETTKRYIVTKNNEKEKSVKIIDNLLNY